MSIEIPKTLNPRLDHIGIAVENIESASKLYLGLGLPVGNSEIIANEGFEVLFFHAGESNIELIAPLNDNSTVAKFLKRRGPGLHHIAFRVDDLRLAIKECIAHGFTAIDTQPRLGVGGSLIAFLHPKTTGGVLIELMQNNS